MPSINHALNQKATLISGYELNVFGDREAVVIAGDVPCRFARASKNAQMSSDKGYTQKIVATMHTNMDYVLKEGMLIEYNNTTYRIEDVKETIDFNGEPFLQYALLSEKP